MPREFPKYDIVVKRGGEVATGSGTRKRIAIRTVRSLLRRLAPGAKGEVRVTQPGRKRGTLIYQAHTDATGKVVAEEL